MALKIDKKEFKANIISHLKNRTARELKEAQPWDLYMAISQAVMSYIQPLWAERKTASRNPKVKETFYFSAEFLMGRAFDNNLINFGLENEVVEVLNELDVELGLLETEESDAGLGNGGLGRLAACFLDSLATLGYPGHGYGIRYKYGMFEQRIQNGFQTEYPDEWFEKGDPWQVRRASEAVHVKFGGYVDYITEDTGRVGFRRNDAEIVIAVPYDMPIIGYRNGVINTLRLWQAQAPQPFDLAAFNAGEYEKAVAAQNAAENISRVLYPNDNSPRGKELRLRQQYFFCSASLQDIITRYIEAFGTKEWKHFPERIAIQLNDTHPVVAIPELMRQLMDWQGLEWAEAWEIVRKTFAYTNHTVLVEALEAWNIEMFRGVLPRVYQIIEEINRRFMEELRTEYPNDYALHHRMSIIADGTIKMAHLAIVGSHKVNGVAALHTDILKKDVLKDWYTYWPEKFLNKTNGITPRRWIVKANPDLTKLIDSKLGEGWKTDLDQLQKLKDFEKDTVFLDKLMEVKLHNKKQLATAIKGWTGEDINPNAIFDIQIKRLHEYKRQLLNVLHIIHLYHQIKANPALDIHPRVFIFGGKSASGYWRAKSIIKLINNVASVVNNDSDVNGKIKVIFIPNYRVSVAEKLFPGADVSEQISTAGKEASGTGNMKFMANGAITLGTLDGANVEIHEEVGDDNCVIFGATADEISDLTKSGTYNPWQYYNSNPALKKVIDSLIDGTFTRGEDHSLFQSLYDSLLNGVDGSRPDVYFLLLDFQAYCEAQQKVDVLYRDKKAWAKISLMNIACCGKFSSDRTIHEYAKEIWNIKPLKV
ncbi:MAG: glycogen/starch/alpha-glucan phosphorylase [Brevinema sp.]